MNKTQLLNSDGTWNNEKLSKFYETMKIIQKRMKTEDQPESGMYDVYTMKGAKWACVEMTSDNRKCATSKMFKKLFDYINSNGIKMTIPVATKEEGNKFTECFY